MDKKSEHINRLTLEFSNRIYEELSTIICHREDLRYFNYDNNDEKIDGKLERMFEMIDDIYNSSIEKKTKFISKPTTPKLQPRKIKFPEENIPELNIHTPSPRTPKKKKNIKVEISDMVESPSNIVESSSDVLETIMYSSDEESYDKLSSDEELILAPNYKESDELVFLGLEEDGETEWYEQAKDLGMIHCSWCKKNLPKEDVYKVVTSHKSFTTLSCKNCIERYKFVKIN